MRSRVVFPHPLGPMMEDELALVDVEMDVHKGSHARVALAVDVGQSAYGYLRRGASGFIARFLAGVHHLPALLGSLDFPSSQTTVL